MEPTEKSTMDKDTKRFLGCILGEVLRLQRQDEKCALNFDSGVVYGLLHGFEESVDLVLEKTGWVSKEQVGEVEKILDPYNTDDKKLAQFNGFYDIEPALNAAGIDRGLAIRILRYLYAREMYMAVIEKMDSSNSPTECRTFELSEWDH